VSALDALAAAAQVLIRHLAWEAWLATAVFAVVAVAAVLLPRRWCRLRQLLWVLVLCRLLLPTDLATPVSMWGLVGLRAAPAPLASGPGPAGAATDVAAPEVGPLGAAAAGRAVPAGAAAALPRPPVALPVAAATAWVTGVLLVAAVLSRRRRHFRGVADRAVPVLEPRLLERAVHWRVVMGVRRRVRLLRSDEIEAPFTVGSLAPRIVLPGRLADGGADSLSDCVLAHEMAHVGRWDDLVLQLQAAVAALYFFHPVAWFAFRFSREEADRACDQLVVARGRIPARTYGASLVASVSRGAGARLDPVPALAPTPRQVMARLETLADSSLPAPGRIPSFAAVLAFGIVLQPAKHCGERCAAPSEAAGAAAGGSASRARGVSLVAHPLPGSRITRRYGVVQRLPGGEFRRHWGVDMGAVPDTRVHAAARGVVVFAGEGFPGEDYLGRVVVVDHGDGVSTLYGQLESIAVARGAPVAPGAALGTVGAARIAGCVPGGPRLHFEVRRGNVPISPAPFGSLREVRRGHLQRVACRSLPSPGRAAV
jgi:beta-lactamase regulating signal transducer with metallopeptidase domain